MSDPSPHLIDSGPKIKQNCGPLRITAFGMTSKEWFRGGGSCGVCRPDFSERSRARLRQITLVKGSEQCSFVNQHE